MILAILWPRHLLSLMRITFMMHTLANSDPPQALPGERPALEELHDINEFRFKLADALQSSLDLHEILANFYQMLQRVIRCSGMEYRLQTKDIRLALGTHRAHRAHYTLKRGEIAVGEMTFFRGAKFSEKELSKMEALLALLMLPLRNALLYRDALENSMRDSLTGIGNRAALELTLQRELKLGLRTQRPLSLLIADVDSFKQVNDRFGHAMGDRLLVLAVSLIKGALRETDQVFRYGGDEFVVILSNTGGDEAESVAERIRQAAAACELPGAAGCERITLSLGIGCSSKEDSRDSLFKKADEALYQAKKDGRNRVARLA
jgi:diguanylate cyclase (GGDEF)-like protein